MRTATLLHLASLQHQEPNIISHIYRPESLSPQLVSLNALATNLHISDLKATGISGNIAASFVDENNLRGLDWSLSQTSQKVDTFQHDRGDSIEPISATPSPIAETTTGSTTNPR